MTPFITAMELGLPRIQERTIQTRAEHDPPICVDTTADVAIDPDVNALPAGVYLINNCFFFQYLSCVWVISSCND